MSIEIRGLDETLARLRGVPQELKKRAQRILVEESHAILLDAKLMCPVDTGTLRASGTVTVGADEVQVSFGGPSAPYALYVHENLEAFHPVGQAKFLETAVLQRTPHLLGRLRDLLSE